MTEDEFMKLMNSPVMKRMWEISETIHDGTADAATVEAWEGMKESMLSAMEAVNRALKSYPPERHEELTRKWVREVIEKQAPLFPTFH